MRIHRVREREKKRKIVHFSFHTIDTLQHYNNITKYMLQLFNALRIFYKLHSINHLNFEYVCKIRSNCKWKLCVLLLPWLSMKSNPWDNCYIIHSTFNITTVNADADVLFLYGNLNCAIFFLQFRMNVHISHWINSKYILSIFNFIELNFCINISYFCWIL